MKNSRLFSSSILIACCLFLFFNCTPEDSIPKPVLGSTVMSVITESTATCTSSISSDGGNIITACGVCWSTTPDPTIEDDTTSDVCGTAEYTSTLTNLNPNTTYYVRAYATNKGGTAYGLQVTFTTRSYDLTTFPATSIMAQSAICGGFVSSYVDSLTLTERGICWSTSPNPTANLETKMVDNSSSDTLSCTLTNLLPNTTYYARIYGINNFGTTYGNEISFTTLAFSGTMTDIDGNVYHYITIGTQTWLMENLKTTKYRDGTAIPNVTDGVEWSELTSGAYCDYENTPGNSSTYGRLYNWYALTDRHNIAPVGWHVATDAEWTTLANYLGSGDVAGGKLKETGTAHWSIPNTAATNQYGFNALPGGKRDYSDQGAFEFLGMYGVWWSASDDTSTTAWFRDMSHENSVLYRGTTSFKCGFSVRCVRNN